MNIRHLLVSGCAFVAVQGVPVHAASGADATLTEPDPDIVVTARRREENILDVPIAITAISGRSLADQGVQKVADLGQVAPGLGITATATGGKSRPVYELRGVYPTDVLSGQDQSVGVYLNEIYIARPTGTNQTMFDIQNVQVLYGPQGTLFGRNTPSGAILISSKKPTDRLEGEFWGGYGKFNEVTLGAVLNLPLGEKAQLRVGGQHLKRDGYALNIANGQRLDDENNHSLRASLRLLPTENVESLTIFDYFRSNTNYMAGSLERIALAGQTSTLADGHVTPLATTISGSYPTAAAEAAAQLARGPRQVKLNLITDERVLSWGITNSTTIDLASDLKIKNILGYRKNSSHNNGDGDKSILPILSTSPVSNDQTQFSEELQIQGKSFDGKLDWIIGGYYFHENSGDRSINLSSLFGTTSYSLSSTSFRGITKSKSVFFQGTYALLRNLNFTGGLRYNWDERQGIWDNPRVIERGNPVVQANTCSLAQDAANATNPAEIDADRDCYHTDNVSYKRATYTLSVDYKPTDSLMFYLSHRKGYRAGGFNGRGNNRVTTTPFRPEVVSNIEVGAKAELPLGGDAKMTFDVALYRDKYTDLQRSVVVINPVTNGVVTSIINAAQATIKGFEAKINLRVMPELSFGGSWAHNDAKYDRFEGVRACPVLNTACASAQRVIVTATNLPFGTAKDTVTGNVVITPVDTPETGKVTGTASFNYRSSWFLQNDLPFLVAPVEGRSLVNLSMAWDNIYGSGASVEASVRNLFNKTYRSSGLSTITSQGFVSYFYGDPRMYGLTLRYKFSR